MSTIVVGIDGFEESRSALVWAAQEARIRKATLRVVHSHEVPYRVSGLVVRTGEVSSTNAATAEARVAMDLIDTELQATGLDACGLRIERRSVEGKPAKVLVTEAEGADLLVVGSTRHRGAAGAVLGDVANACVRQARCPVVVVPPRAS